MYAGAMATGLQRRHDFPSITQLSVFLDNRVGKLMNLVQALETSEARIIALSVIDSADCAIVRLVVDDVDAARRALRDQDFPISETELVAVELPGGKLGIKAMCSALLTAEINIHYVYPLMIHPADRRVLALHVDDYMTAIEVLQGHSFRVLSQGEIQP